MRFLDSFFSDPRRQIRTNFGILEHCTGKNRPKKNYGGPKSCMLEVKNNFCLYVQETLLSKILLNLF